jgi:hypothetical protein
MVIWAGKGGRKDVIAFQRAFFGFDFYMGKGGRVMVGYD